MGRIHLVLVVGQGTAAVAGQAVAAAIAKALPDVVVSAMPGTELSGWGLSGAGLPDDMLRCPGSGHKPIGYDHGHQ